MTSVIVGKRKIFLSDLFWSLTWLNKKDQTSDAERLETAMQMFVNTHRNWVDRGFNNQFLEHRVQPMIKLYERYGKLPSPKDIALVWDEDFGNGYLDERKELVAALIDDLCQFIAVLKTAVR